MPVVRKRRWYQFCLRGLFLGILFTSVYLAAYKALLRPMIVPREGFLGEIYGYRKPEFLIGGTCSQVALSPLVWADRRMRPDYWDNYRAPWSKFEQEYTGEIRYGIDQAETTP